MATALEECSTETAFCCWYFTEQKDSMQKNTHKEMFPIYGLEFIHVVQTVSGAHPVSYPMGAGASFTGGKAAGREADKSPPTSTEVKKTWIYTSTSPYFIMAWCLIKLST
jgi:hypothetical protein